jgi:hypothetical protein
MRFSLYSWSGKNFGFSRHNSISFARDCLCFGTFNSRTFRVVFILNKRKWIATLSVLLVPPNTSFFLWWRLDLQGSLSLFLDWFDDHWLRSFYLTLKILDDCLLHLKRLRMCFSSLSLTCCFSDCQLLLDVFSCDFSWLHRVRLLARVKLQLDLVLGCTTWRCSSLPLFVVAQGWIQFPLVKFWLHRVSFISQGLRGCHYSFALSVNLFDSPNLCRRLLKQRVVSRRLLNCGELLSFVFGTAIRRWLSESLKLKNWIRHYLIKVHCTVGLLLLLQMCMGKRTIVLCVKELMHRVDSVFVVMLPSDPLSLELLKDHLVELSLHQTVDHLELRFLRHWALMLVGDWERLRNLCSNTFRPNFENFLSDVLWPVWDNQELRWIAGGAFCLLLQSVLFLSRRNLV